MFGGKKKEEASKKKEDAVSSTKEYTLWKVLLIGDDSDATRAFLDRVLLHEGDAAERLTGFRFSTRILPVNGVLVKVQLYSPWSIRDVRQLSASYYRGTAGRVQARHVRPCRPVDAIPARGYSPADALAAG
eukprot:CAMPEP_0177636686 /NCGR_PEP_ID=MMETSP0447-20121125/4569_1 /TAXON_ID=0 /ORGANISM="Stygamoeba regulata, Strain BSH-02190019" /LENGTH=130 /DNA_ID=CAMNT_0019138561 /DNA_START=245 /DNA_END=633 /DNA_ORIENTATION=+